MERACRTRDFLCRLDYVNDAIVISNLDHDTTLFTFNDVTHTEEVNVRLERMRTLLHRLSRVRDTAVEAELITQLTLETEAVGRIRTAGAHATPAAGPTSSHHGGITGDGRRRTSVPGARIRVRGRRRIARDN